MRSLRSAFVLAATLLLTACLPPAGVLAAETPAASASPKAPCSDPEHRQFDFWLGNWVVKDPKGEVAGRNRIVRILDGCALQENWTGNSGMFGTSFNIFDKGDRKWHQTWVDNQGLLLVLTGEFREGRMVLTGERPSEKAAGKGILHRITWSTLGPRDVRQRWEASRDGGESWNVVFDGLYQPEP